MARQKSPATIAKELSKEIRTSPAEIAKQIVDSYKERRAAIMSGIANNEPGSKNFLDYQLALAKLDRAERDELCSRGITVENLGVATKPNFVFSAEVKVDGGVLVKLNDKEDEEIRRRLDEEFS